MGNQNFNLYQHFGQLIYSWRIVKNGRKKIKHVILLAAFAYLHLISMKNRARVMGKRKSYRLLALTNFGSCAQGQLAQAFKRPWSWGGGGGELRSFPKLQGIAYQGDYHVWGIWINISPHLGKIFSQTHKTISFTDLITSYNWLLSLRATHCFWILEPIDYVFYFMAICVWVY